MSEFTPPVKKEEKGRDFIVGITLTPRIRGDDPGLLALLWWALRMLVAGVGLKVEMMFRSDIAKVRILEANAEALELDNKQKREMKAVCGGLDRFNEIQDAAELMEEGKNAESALAEEAQRHVHVAASMADAKRELEESLRALLMNEGEIMFEEAADGATTDSGAEPEDP